MERSRLVACVDTSPCIALNRIGATHVILDQFAEVLLPESVFFELAMGIELDDAWTICQSPNVKVIPSGGVSRGGFRHRLPSNLHEGESEVIRLAGARGAVAILDDGLARKAAVSLNVQVVGTVGLLLRAKSIGSVARVAPLLEKLVSSGYRLHPDLVRRAIEEAGES